LSRYLRKARRQGLSIVLEIDTPWTNAIPTSIRHPRTQQVSGVVVTAGSAVLFTEARMLAFSSHLMEAAQELSLTPTASSVFAVRYVRSAA
jgi:DNA-binding IclR family transcriptional regulator